MLGKHNKVTQIKGFSIVELLVVLGIIAILATIQMGGLQEVRSRVYEILTRADMKQISTAIYLLENDTGKWPNGCLPGEVFDPEVSINERQSGLVSAQAPRPETDDGDGRSGGECTWTNSDVAAWNGPYLSFTKDPWGMPYLFDPDYYRFHGCPGKTEEKAIVAIISFGPNKVGINAYDCDDIVFKLGDRGSIPYSE
ncbi:MAG: prepilin-type N-terminal cleavage/methylation domain-containing protein [Patescibacteria group bacterium]